MSQPSLSGPLSGTLGPGVFNVVGNCGVAAGNTLTIQPGTVLQHTGNFSWTISGTITALGTESQPIEFIPQNASIPWGGIRFNTGAPTQSRLEWCVIDKCETYVNGGGLYIGNSGITLVDCEITNCSASSGGGIYAYNTNAALVIEDCYIANNTAGNGGGMYFSGCNGSIVRYSEIAYNSSTNT